MDLMVTGKFDRNRAKIPLMLVLQWLKDQLKIFSRPAGNALIQIFGKRKPLQKIKALW